jgi:hypothetical protein
LELPGICYFPDLRQTRGAKNIPKTILKTRLKTKETAYTLFFGKYLVIFFMISADYATYEKYVETCLHVKEELVETVSI